MTDVLLFEASNNNVSEHKESAVDANVIYDKEDSRGRITIFESLDKLSAWMRIIPGKTGDRFYLEDILFIIAQFGIVTGVKTNEIKTFLDTMHNVQELPDRILIAAGHPPVAAIDGHCELLFNPDDPYVEKGQVILRITDPVDGSPGENIYGEPIEPASGKKPTVIAGDNVFENENGEFESEVFGRAVFNDNVISVEKVLHVKISPDAMEASISYTGTKKLTHSRIKEALYAHNIIFGIDDNAIDTLITSLNMHDMPVTDVVVARGIPRQEGKDGEIKFLFHESRGINPNEYIIDGMIVRGTNIIKSVDQGQEIAYIIPHVDPVNGKDIYGRILPAKKVRKVKLRAGKNVTVSEDGLHFYAQAGGRPIVEGDKISVHDVLTIPGDLDYKVGNIDFDGIVEIDGDVFDGFNIRATKSIIIRGVVGASNLEAGLDIQIQGGCKGLNKAKIIAGGNIEAKYIHEFFVQAHGDIIVKNEIVSSDVKCLGRIIVHYGSIRGGSLCAKKGIESFDIGNDVGIKTTLIPGDDFEVNDQCKNLDEVFVQKKKEFDALSKRIAPLLKNRELIAKLPPDTQEKLKETLCYMKTLQKEQTELINKKNALIEQSMKEAVPEVVVMHYIYHGVILKIGKSRRVISSLLEGPLRLYEEDDRITVEPYSEKRRQMSQHHRLPS
ncbi:MAG: FapA family protein [Desulfobacterota bacterium]|nr:FapA family protein [Thermodesulfobacteriota bacterium]